MELRQLSCHQKAGDPEAEKVAINGRRESGNSWALEKMVSLCKKLYPDSFCKKKHI